MTYVLRFMHTLSIFDLSVDDRSSKTAWVMISTFGRLTGLVAQHYARDKQFAHTIASNS